ncbi:hypothetical protein ACE38W_16870 [Chitinophaga sp. Hz27]|uniref:hypothetical protein n=1 Tax=Chitinophaga sp. Hz27 TaxID=3347169 RepID=UPI0035DB710E
MEHIRLNIEGRLKPTVESLFAEVFVLKELKPNEIVLFCSFSGYNIPVGHRFSEISHKGVTYKCNMVLKAVSQQFFKPFDEIPYGWKTICKFEFSDGEIPDDVKKLPALDGWAYVNENLVFQ